MVSDPRPGHSNDGDRVPGGWSPALLALLGRQPTAPGTGGSGAWEKGPWDPQV